jgi:hypothetical protein
MSTVLPSSTRPMLGSWHSRFQNDSDQDVEEGEVDDVEQGHGAGLWGVAQQVRDLGERRNGLRKEGTSSMDHRARQHHQQQQQQHQYQSRKRPRSPSTGTDHPKPRQPVSLSKVPQSEPSPTVLNSTTIATKALLRRKDGGSFPPPTLLSSPLSTSRIQRHNDRPLTSDHSDHSNSYSRSQLRRQSIRPANDADGGDAFSRGGVNKGEGAGRDEVDIARSSKNNTDKINQGNHQYDQLRAASNTEPFTGCRGKGEGVQEHPTLARGESHSQQGENTALGQRSRDRREEQQKGDDSDKQRKPDMCLHWEPRRQQQPELQQPRDRRSPSESSFHRTNDKRFPKPQPQQHEQPFRPAVIQHHYAQTERDDSSFTNKARRSSLDSSRFADSYSSRDERVDTGPESNEAHMEPVRHASGLSSNTGMTPVQAPLDRYQPFAQRHPESFTAPSLPSSPRHSLGQPRTYVSGSSCGRSRSPPQSSAFKANGNGRSWEEHGSLPRQQERAADTTWSRNDIDKPIRETYSTSLAPILSHRADEWSWSRDEIRPRQQELPTVKPLSRSSCTNDRDGRFETQNRPRPSSPSSFCRYGDERRNSWQPERRLPPSKGSQWKQHPAPRFDEHRGRTGHFDRGNIGRPRSRSPPQSSSRQNGIGNIHSRQFLQRENVPSSLLPSSHWDNHNNETQCKEAERLRPRSPSPSASVDRQGYARNSSCEDLRRDSAQPPLGPSSRWQSPPPHGRYEDRPPLPSATSDWRRDSVEGDMFSKPAARPYEIEAKRNAGCPDRSSFIRRDEVHAPTSLSMPPSESHSTRSTSSLGQKQFHQSVVEDKKENDWKDLSNFSSALPQTSRVAGQQDHDGKEFSPSVARLGSRWCPPISPAATEKRGIAILPTTDLTPVVVKTLCAPRDRDSRGIRVPETLPRSSPLVAIANRWEPPKVSNAGDVISPSNGDYRNGSYSDNDTRSNRTGEGFASLSKGDPMAQLNLGTQLPVATTLFPPPSRQLASVASPTWNSRYTACTEQNVFPPAALSQGSASSILVAATTKTLAAVTTSAPAPSKPTVVKKKETPKSSLGIPMKWLKPPSRPPKKVVVKNPAKANTNDLAATKILQKEVNAPSLIAARGNRSEDFMKIQQDTKDTSDTVSITLFDRKVDKEMELKSYKKPMKKRMVDELAGFSSSVSEEKKEKDWEMSSSLYDDEMKSSGPHKKRAKKLKKLIRTRSPSPFANANHRTVTDSEGGSTVSSINRDKAPSKSNHRHATEMAEATPDLATDDSLTSLTDMAHRTSSTSVPAVIVPLKNVAATNPDDVDMLLGSPEHHPDGLETSNIRKQQLRKGGTGRQGCFSSSSDEDSSSDSDDESDTDDEEVMLWASRMFGISPTQPALARLKATQGREGMTTPTSVTEGKAPSESSKMKIRLSIPKPLTMKNRGPENSERKQNDHDKAIFVDMPQSNKCEARAEERQSEKLKKKKRQNSEPGVDGIANDAAFIQRKAERKKNKKMKKKLRKILTENSRLRPEEDAVTVDEVAMEREMVEERRRREEAKILTAAQIQAILGEDWNGGGRGGSRDSNWVRRSTRQPLASILNSKQMQTFLHKLRTNDPDMVVLKMKKYIADPNVPQVVMNAALEALEENTNCEALYIQVSNLWTCEF